MKRFQPHKLKFARNRLGLSMEALIERMGENSVSKMSISKFERGLITPSHETSVALAAACCVDIEYLYSGDVNLSRMQFRYRFDKPDSCAAAIEAKISYEVEKQFKLESFLERTTFTNPIESRIARNYSDIENLSVFLRKEWEIGSQPIHSVYELLQSHGIMLVELYLDSENLLGVTTWIDDKIPVIVINTHSNETIERKRFTALHELGHIVLSIHPVSEEEFLNSPDCHPGSCGAILKAPEIEPLCHRFAGAMLITADCMQRRLGSIRSKLSLSELISIDNLYGISVSALVHRAHDLGIIPNKEYNRWFDECISSNPMEEGWGNYPIPEVADRIVLLEQILRAEKIDFDEYTTNSL